MREANRERGKSFICLDFRLPAARNPVLRRGVLPDRRLRARVASWRRARTGRATSSYRCVVRGGVVPRDHHRERVRFNIINRETGNRVRYQVVDAETGDVVPQDDRVKGYEADDGYVLLEEDELDEVALESTHTIDIETFVPRAEVDELYLDESYLPRAGRQGRLRGLCGDPRGHGEEGLVGLARVVLYRRERLLMLAAARQGHRGDAAALQQRGARRAAVFRRHPGRQDCQATCSSWPSHIIKRRRPLRSVEVRGSLRDRAERS